jgi:alpha-L-arabinofuranosidase
VRDFIPSGIRPPRLFQTSAFGIEAFFGIRHAAFGFLGQRWFVLLLLPLLTANLRAQTSTNVVVSFTTTNAAPLNPGIAGFSLDMLADAVEYDDTNFLAMAAALSPGWLRYPGGATEDAFAWTNGITDTNWIAGFPAAETNLIWPTVKLTTGKGGQRLADMAAMCGRAGGARIVVTVNAFTDDAVSAGNFAAYALSNHIPVAVWELCNEPYVFSGNQAGDFFLNATDYVARVKPYRDAIKAADSNAVVGIYFEDAGYPEPDNWDTQLAAYTNKYWDAVVYHHYPALPTTASFADLMALDNWELASNTTARMQNYLIPDNQTNVTFLISEFAPARGNGSGGQSPPTTTLYGGIYSAEYLMRLSTLTQMTFVGPYQLLDSGGIAQTNNDYQAVTTAWSGGYTTNTDGMPFGFYLSAQVCGSSVANGALTKSIGVYSTCVGTNSPTVPVDTNGPEGPKLETTMPAVYAQAYQGGNGKRYVVLTNKGSNAVPVVITQDGVALTNQFLETYVTDDDPAATNTAPEDSPVQIQTAMVTNAIMIPEYSVARLEWTVFTVPTPKLSVAATNGVETLRWAGLTNVIYNVQAATNLLNGWTTLGRVINTQTNFAFTNWNSGRQEYYRLAVP